MHRRDVRLVLLLLMGGVGLGMAGCGEDFSDEPFGSLDLSTAYDGGSPSNPAGGIPTTIAATTGYVEGVVAEYYDFGLVPAVSDPFTGVPLAVRVQPMYFFFDPGGVPLFSRPVRELRDGTDWMKGGENVLDPNPTDFCAAADADPVTCKQRNDQEREKSYPLRQRNHLVDPNRGNSDDYQRPIVDLTPFDNDPPRRQYTGLWEIIEVTAPSGYKPDSIKQYDTLKRGLDSGKFKARSTGKVINCPMIDERSDVSRGITARRIFHPRIELWYQRQLAYCFLANGWETLGNPDGQLYFAGQDDARLDTFDVSRISVGEGPTLSTELAVAVGKAYEPALVTSDQSGVNPLVVTRIANNVISSSQPKQHTGDPSGYSPLRWMYNVQAPSDYVAGGWKSVADIDPSKASPRSLASGDPLVKNLPLRGVGLKCSFSPMKNGNDPRTGDPLLQCGQFISVPDPDDSTKKKMVFSSTGDPVCNAERDPKNPNDPPLECNPTTCFCDAPIVGYGQACGPGLGQCRTTADAFAPFGYKCFPPFGGFCQLSCNPGAPNTREKENVGKELKDQVDTRCHEIPGFVCFGQFGCLKFCDQNVSDPMQCSAVVNVPTGTNMSSMIDIQAGQTCQDFGLQVCAWPDTWTPADFPVK